MKKKNTSLAKSIGKVINFYRKKEFPGHGGQGKCIEAYGASREKWSRWEHGIVTPSDAEQRKLAEFFGITMAELRGEKMPPAQADGMDEKIDSLAESLRSAALIRYHLDAAQEYMLRGELSADAFLELTDSLLAAIQDSIVVEGKSLHKTFPLKG